MVGAGRVPGRLAIVVGVWSFRHNWLEAAGTSGEQEHRQAGRKSGTGRPGFGIRNWSIHLVLRDFHFISSGFAAWIETFGR